MDEKEKFAQFQREVMEELKEPEMKRTIARIAHRLVASSFFLHRSPPDEAGTPYKGTHGLLGKTDNLCKY